MVTQEIVSIENDHRQVAKGSLFVCINGYTVDGHSFATEAVAEGAVAIISERPLDISVPNIVVKDSQRIMAFLADVFYQHPTQSLNLIGITGTNGKTTISHIIEKIFHDSGHKTGLIGTMYTMVDSEKFKTKNTTPDSLTLQKTFYQMRERAVDTAVMEVSSHALELGRVFGCDFNVAVFSNLTQDHLDYHGTMEHYRYAKSLLFSRLGNVYNDNQPKYAVLNADDDAAAFFAKATTANIITYGIDKEADIKATSISISSKGTRFSLHTPVGNREVTIKMIGKFSVYNVLAAIATCLISNFELDTIIKSISEIKGVPGRFESVDAGQDYTVIVDYSHTPDSLENVLKTISEFATGRIFTIVGCGGDRDKTKRPIMAEIACRKSTNAIFTSDNPRSEDPLQILKDMEAGVQGEHY